ncbi:hypothetical protein V8D89_008943 [Ganoderma adspersum]
MFPYYAFPTHSDSEYFRALAEERAAREQYAAARRAQEEARTRAARAQAARRAYAFPYSSYLGDDYLTPSCDDLGVDNESSDDAFGAYGFGPSPRSLPLGYRDPHTFGYGSSPYAQRALMEERRRRELVELEREKELRRLEEERIRKILREEREREEAAQQKLLEEERIRRALEEERLKQALREEVEEEAKERERAQMGAQQTSVDPMDILRALGLAPPAPVSEERFGRQPNARTSPSGVHRTTPSPIRPFPFGRTPTCQHPRTPSPPTKTPSLQPATSTSIPVSSSTVPTPEQLAAAEHILAAYRAHISRKAALATISLIRKRFLAARSGFALPTTLDYDVASHGRAPPTTVVLGPDANVSELAKDDADVLEGTPRLAYSPTNAPLHAYEEELNRILGALDAVESNGDMGVRSARRELARTVEREAEKVERWRGVVWRWWVESQKAASALTPAPAPAPVSAPEPEVARTPVEPLTSVVSPLETGEASSLAEAPQETTPMEVDATSASDSSPVPAPASGMNFDDTVTITVVNPTPPEPVAVVAPEPTPEAQFSTNTTHDSDASPQPDAPSVDISLSSWSTSTPDAASDEAARPATPALSQGPSEPEEMDIEPLEVHTPPLAAHTPIVAVDAELVCESLHLEQKEPVLGTAEAPREEAV